jgi:hypothetical protein
MMYVLGLRDGELGFRIQGMGFRIYSCGFKGKLSDLGLTVEG